VTVSIIQKLNQANTQYVRAVCRIQKSDEIAQEISSITNHQIEGDKSNDAYKLTSNIIAVNAYYLLTAMTFISMAFLTTWPPLNARVTSTAVYYRVHPWTRLIIETARAYTLHRFEFWQRLVQTVMSN